MNSAESNASFLSSLVTMDKSMVFFPKVKLELGGHLIEGDSVRTAWERVVRTLETEDFRVAFDRRLERQKKCVRVGGEYIEKI